MLCKGSCNGQDKFNCFGNCSMKEVRDLRHKFWNGPDDTDKKVFKFPNRETRRLRMRDSLNAAFDGPNKEFKFFVGNKRVCETAYLRILGKKLKLE